MESLSWDKYSSRILVLITDAGPLPSGDKHASVRMDVTEMADFARTRGIWISVLHIKSPGGRQNHAYCQTYCYQISFHLLMAI